MKRLCLVLVSLLLCTGRLPAAELMVFAAASLTDALKEIGTAYEKERGTKVRFNFSASSILARQIQEGARADIFFSADEEKIEMLDRANLLVPGTRTNLLSNTLVVVVPTESTLQLRSPSDLQTVKRLAIAEPKTVPAGIYARKFLIDAGLWESLEKRIIPTENVRGALTAVEAGNVDAGIVYRTDAAISKRVRIALEITTAQKITYPVALLAETKARSEAERFLQWLRNESSSAVFERYHFIVLAGAATK